jgi:hypothetical protein
VAGVRHALVAPHHDRAADDVVQPERQHHRPGREIHGSNALRTTARGRIASVVRILGHDLQVSIEHLVPAVEDLQDQWGCVQHAGEHVGAERLSFSEIENRICDELDLRLVERGRACLLTCERAPLASDVARGNGRRLRGCRCAGQEEQVGAEVGSHGLVRSVRVPCPQKPGETSRTPRKYTTKVAASHDCEIAPRGGAVPAHPHRDPVARAPRTAGYDGQRTRVADPTKYRELTARAIVFPAYTGSCCGGRIAPSGFLFCLPLTSVRREPLRMLMHWRARLEEARRPSSL